MLKVNNYTHSARDIVPLVAKTRKVKLTIAAIWLVTCLVKTCTIVIAYTLGMGILTAVNVAKKFPNEDLIYGSSCPSRYSLTLNVH